MAGIVEVCVGWLLGIGSSYIFRFYDRREKRNNFINGLETELLEILPQLVGTVYLIKQAMGQFDHDFLHWVDSVCSNMQRDIFPQTRIWLKECLRQTPDEMSKLSEFMASQEKGLVLNLKPFCLKYVDHNIDSLPLIDVNYQKLVIEITTKIYIINQEVEYYIFYFEKSFDPESCKINKELIYNNIQKSRAMISDILMITIDKITNLISMINNRKGKEPLYQVKNILFRISKFIEDRRSCS